MQTLENLRIDLELVRSFEALFPGREYKDGWDQTMIRKRSALLAFILLLFIQGNYSTAPVVLAPSPMVQK